MSAKGVLINPTLLAVDLVNMFDRTQTPECTEGTEGYIWVKSILGNYEITLHSYFLPGDIDWYGCRWTDVHCFSIIDYWWHYSIGDVTFIIDQEEKTNGI